ncbi:MAG: hypothetical protein KatS3mg111_3677 [Pirellulaceae bacterium]|nr:MAG: hypothetical protein KatS3mg111_3677 [Pirellulaceae bacterium]
MGNFRAIPTSHLVPPTFLTSHLVPPTLRWRNSVNSFSASARVWVEYSGKI